MMKQGVRLVYVTQYSRNNMAHILLAELTNAFSWVKSIVFSEYCIELLSQGLDWPVSFDIYGHIL